SHPSDIRRLSHHQGSVFAALLPAHARGKTHVFPAKSRFAPCAPQNYPASAATTVLMLHLPECRSARLRFHARGAPGPSPARHMHVNPRAIWKLQLVRDGCLAALETASIGPAPRRTSQEARAGRTVSTIACAWLLCRKVWPRQAATPDAG